MPGTIVCFEHEQVCLYHNIFIDRALQNKAILNSFSPVTKQTTLSQPCLYINCYKKSSISSTTINSKELYYYEMCVRKPFSMNEKDHLNTSGQDNSINFSNFIPLSFMLTTNPRSLSCLNQWLNLFFNCEENLFHTYYSSSQNKENNQSEIKYIICDSSIPLVETLLGILNKQTLVSYANSCFAEMVRRSEGQQDLASNNEFGLDLKKLNTFLLKSIGVVNVENATKPNYVIHTCTNQIMKEIGRLCKFYYSYGDFINFKFLNLYQIKTQNALQFFF